MHEPLILRFDCVSCPFCAPESALSRQWRARQLMQFSLVGYVCFVTAQTSGNNLVPVPPHVPEEGEPDNSDTLLDIGKKRASKDQGREVKQVNKAGGGQPASADGGQRQDSSFVRRTSSFTAATAKLAAEAVAKDGEFELDADALAKYREDGGLEELDKLGGLKVLIKELHTNAQDGLRSDELQTIRLDARKQRYGVSSEGEITERLTYAPLFINASYHFICVFI